MAELKADCGCTEYCTDGIFIALSFSIRETLWFLQFHETIRTHPQKMTKTTLLIKEDNQGCISVPENDVVNDRSKRIDIKYKFLCDDVRKNTI